MYALRSVLQKTNSVKLRSSTQTKYCKYIFLITGMRSTRNNNYFPTGFVEISLRYRLKLCYYPTSTYAIGKMPTMPLCSPWYQFLSS